MEILSEIMRINKEIKEILKDDKALIMSITLLITSLFAFVGVEILSYYDILLSIDEHS